MDQGFEGRRREGSRVMNTYDIGPWIMNRYDELMMQVGAMEVEP